MKENTKIKIADTIGYIGISMILYGIIAAIWNIQVFGVKHEGWKVFGTGLVLVAMLGLWAWLYDTKED
jgi:cbb3-type cytochrome oxidase subunit 3